MPDAEVAGSSPAETPAPPDLGAWTDQEYETWRTTGDSPAPPKSEPKTTEESAPSEPSAAEPEKAAPETSPESDPETKEPEKEKGKALKARSAELQQEIDQLQARLRQRRELRQELEALANQPQEKPAPAKAAPDGEPMLDTFLDEAEKKGETFAQAIQAHARAHSKWAIDQHETQKAAAEQQRKATEKATVFQQRVDAFAAEHPDYDTVLEAGKSVRFGNEAFRALQDFALESEKPGELMYHLGKNLSTLQNLASLSPIALVRELTRIELGLGATGGPIPLATPKKTAEPPPPPAALKGRNTPAADDAEEAIANGDFEKYMTLANKRDIASRAAQRA